MNSCEFIKNVQTDIPAIKILFDTTMALYNLIGYYQGFNISVQDASGVDIAYVVTAQNASDLEQLMNNIQNMQVTIYSRIYLCNAVLDPTTGRLVINLKDISST